MLSTLCAAIALANGAEISRDEFGVAHIAAANPERAFFGFGQAVAEDRLWQMENSRRVARGRLAEIRGASAVASDTEMRRMGYSDVELDAMLAEQTPAIRSAFRAYAEGVNAEISARTKAGRLPPGYAEAGIVPEPWTPADSVAIAVMLARRFGTGGAGELRNMALLEYLKAQPAKAHALDVFDDLLWLNDPRAVPTVAPADDPNAKSHVRFFNPSRADTERHRSQLPALNLLEVMPGIRASTLGESALIAQAVAAPFETGSYCIVVSPQRSASGRAMLLSAPQMGHSIPSIVHEVVLDAPGLQVAGIDVPGVPLVVIGNTPRLAWGLTTGVADTSDIVYSSLDDTKIEKFEATIAVRDAAAQSVVLERTKDGPVVLKNGRTKSVFSQRMSYWKQELSSWTMLFGLYSAESPADIDRALQPVAVNFNFFFATTDGATGWRYTGRLPVRAMGWDPRLPIPSGASADWVRMLTDSERPRVDNPKGGLIANWNNKPARWWPNGDTPAWGRIFRNSVLLDAIPSGRLTAYDLERAAWQIARRDDTSNAAFLELFLGASKNHPELGEANAWLAGYRGDRVEGTPGRLIYESAVREFRRLTFAPAIGNLTGDATFETAVQPSVIAQAVDGATKYDYFGERTPEDVATDALATAWSTAVSKSGADVSAWPLSPAAFRAPDGSLVPYPNRGSYIQVTELATPPFARSVLPPGVAESGPHASDQVDLAKAWIFKRIAGFGKR